jgi:hypothetical protein
MTVRLTTAREPRGAACSACESRCQWPRYPGLERLGLLYTELSQLLRSKGLDFELVQLSFDE